MLMLNGIYIQVDPRIGFTINLRLHSYLLYGLTLLLNFLENKRNCVKEINKQMYK